MMQQHAFLFRPGQWLGEGGIRFSGSDEQLSFYTRWAVKDLGEAGEVSCLQEVEMRENSERIQNSFRFFDLQESSFSLQLRNEMIGLVEGEGFLDEKKIAWEFRDNPAFEGFEVYEKGADGSYLFHAEYLSCEQLRSIIDGRIWPKL